MRDVDNKPADAHNILSLLLGHWRLIEASPEVRNEAEARIVAIVLAACRSAADADTAAQALGAALAWLRNLPWQGPVQRCWSVEEKRTVEQLQSKFSDSNHKMLLNQHLAGERAAPFPQWLIWICAPIGWALFWTAFLFVFPWSPTVQAVFFWNPKVRGMLSLWFVPLLLFALPPLRRRLLSPFRADLVAAARLEEMPRLGFFPDTRAVLGGRAPAAVKALLPGLRGAVILRGEAGLGKTSTLRWLAANATKPVAFLPARDCKDGVDTAIARLIQDVQETGFVRSMVYAGALVVIVDGLNEVTADTREQIRRFATDMSKGDVLIGTQPIEWQPPANARVLDLLPLDRAEAERFLLSRPIGSDPTQKAHGAAYERAVHAFLRRAVDDAMGQDARRAAELVLSNPFDLNFAADLLAQDLMPTATALIDEAFRLADEGSPGEPGYRSLAGLPFPLKRFGRHAVDMRLDDRNWFKSDEFPAEASCLLDRKLLVRRVMRGIAGEEQRIQFRHERVWDFFIDAAFQADPDLWKKHVADVRFRGAYLRIAETWNLKDAKLVGDRLARSAARNGDHTTSDEFLRRLEARDQLEVRHEAPEPALAKGASRSI